MSIVDKERELFAMNPPWMLCVDTASVNLDDLTNCLPGAIIRINGKPSDHVMVIAPDTTLLGCAAGWISEDD